MAKLTLKGGRVIDPATQTDQVTDVLIEGRCVKRIGKISKPDGPVLDASGLIVAPGLIDPHVHLREPGQEDKETIATGAAAAINGGFTTICCMPNTIPTLDDDAGIEFVYRQAARAGLCNVFPVGAITRQRKGEELAEIGLMSQAGAVAFSDDGCAVASAGMMAKALRYVKMTGKAIMQHCEEPTLTSGSVMNAGALATKLGLTGWPAVAESLIIQRDIMLNQSIGCAYHVQHISSAASVDLIRQARKAGQPITAEVSPHHLLLTEDACGTYDPNAKMNPPLRTRTDTDAILKGIRDKTITILATDHAPHTAEEKELEFAAAPFGIIGLDCALALYIKALIEPGVIDYLGLVAMMTINPAQLCGLSTKGSLQPEFDADVTLIDPEEQWTIKINDFASKSRNCPFDGWSVQGRATGTIVGGSVKLLRDSDRLTRR